MSIIGTSEHIQVTFLSRSDICAIPICMEIYSQSSKTIFQQMIQFTNIKPDLQENYI